jgi:hypothetical protein
MSVARRCDNEGKRGRKLGAKNGIMTPVSRLRCLYCAAQRFERMVAANPISTVPDHQKQGTRHFRAFVHEDLLEDLVRDLAQTHAADRSTLVVHEPRASIIYA